MGFTVGSTVGSRDTPAAILEALDTVGATDSTAPTVAITAPLADARVRGELQVLVAASDAVRVTQVDLYRNGMLISGDAVAPVGEPLRLPRRNRMRLLYNRSDS